MSISFLPLNIFIVDPQYLQDYFCPICKNILHDCVNDEFGHTFCLSCIKDVLSRGEICPIDNHPLLSEQLLPTKHIRSFLSRQRVKCLYFQQGCLWEDELSRLEVHLAECEKVDRRRESSVSIPDDSEEAKSAAKNKEETDSNKEIKSMSSEEAEKERTISSQDKSGEKPEEKPKEAVSSESKPSEAVVANPTVLPTVFPSEVPEERIKKLEEALEFCQEVSKTYKTKIDELSRQIYESSLKEEESLRLLDLKIERLLSKVDVFSSQAKEQLPQLLGKKKESDTPQKESFFRAKYISPSLEQNGNVVSCSDLPSKKHEVFIFDFKGNYSFKAVFKLLSDYNWLAFGTVKMDTFSSKGKVFQSREMDHGFNLITSNGFTFHHGHKTRRFEEFDCIKAGATVELHYSREKEVLRLVSNGKKAKITGVDKTSDSYVCLLFTERGEKLECVSIKAV